MYTSRRIVERLYGIANDAYNRVGYSANSNIVMGIRALARIIEDDGFSEESYNWIATSIVPDRRSYELLIYHAQNSFRAEWLGWYLENIINSLYDKSCEVQHQRRMGINVLDGFPEPDLFLRRIIHKPEEQYIPFDLDDDDDSDDDDSDDDEFIDPESPPEYERFPGPLPLYKNIYQDKLLDAGLPLYSEFSLKTMQMSIDQSLLLFL